MITSSCLCWNGSKTGCDACGGCCSMDNNGDGNSNDKLNVSLIFLRKELLYDARNYAFIEGDLMGDDSSHEAHQVFDIGEDGNVDRVTRVLNMTHADSIELLYPFSKQDVDEETQAYDPLIEPKEYTIKLSLPHNFSKTTVFLLEHLIHEYLVCRVLADWMSITKPESEEKWEKKFQALRDRIKDAIRRRSGHIIRPFNPF